MNEEIKILSKDEILAVDDLKQEVVDVPEWGGAVIVRTMSGIERDEFEASMINAETRERSLENFRARLCAMTMVNRNGKRLFPNPEDVKKLGRKSSRALDRIMKVAQRLNGIGPEDVEELTKN